MSLPRYLVPTAALLAAACSAAPGPGAAPPDTAAVSRAIDSTYAAFRAAYARLDDSAVAALYTNDATYHAAGNAPAVGRDAVHRVFRGFFDAMRADSATLALDFRIVRRELAPALAADVGYYQLAPVRRGVRGPASYGRFTTVLRPGPDGRWRFAVDSYTGSTREEWDAAPRHEP